MKVDRYKTHNIEVVVDGLSSAKKAETEFQKVSVSASKWLTET
jgi:hypothetical protein